MFIKKLNKKPIKINKSIKVISLIILLFIIGSMISFIGVIKGERIALVLTKPIRSNSWSTSREIILGCKYILVVIGTLFMLISSLFSIIFFKYWIKNDK